LKGDIVSRDSFFRACLAKRVPQQRGLKVPSFVAGMEIGISLQKEFLSNED